MKNITHKHLSIKALTNFGRYLGLLISLSAFSITNAQESDFEILTLQKAVDSCLSKNPIILTAKLNIKVLEDEKKGIIKYTPINIIDNSNYFNELELDYSFDIEHNSKVHLLTFHKTEKIDNELKIADYQLKILSAELTGKVKSAYYYWLYCNSKLDILSNQKENYSDFLRITNLHYKQGDINFADKMEAETIYNKIKYLYKNSLSDVLIAENKLKSLIINNYYIIPPTKSLSMYLIKESDDSVKRFSADFLINYYKELNDRENQSLHKKSQLKLLQFKNNEDSIKINYQKSIIKTAIANLNAELDKDLIQLTHYDGYILPFSDILIKTYDLKLKKEDITYLEWLKETDKTINMKLEYLHVLNKYNQTAIQLEFFSY